MDDEQTPVIDLGQLGAHQPGRRSRDPLTLAVLGTAVVAAAVFAGTRIDVDGGGAPPASGPRLVAPATASAGERIPVLAYRLRGRCGGTELRLDGAPVTQRLTRYAGTADRPEVFLTLDVPASATAGRHEVALVAPACDGGTDRHLATAVIDVAGPPGQDGENGHSS